MFKYNITSQPGNIWEQINEGIDKSDVFLLFPSFDAKQSMAVKKEVSIAMHREINDQHFKFLSIYLIQKKFLNWALDAQYRIEAFNLPAQEIVEKIDKFIKKGKIEYIQPFLPINYEINEDSLKIIYKRSFILPSFLLVCNKLKESNTLTIETHQNCYKAKRYINENKKDIEGIFISIHTKKYLGKDKSIEIPFRDFERFAHLNKGIKEIYVISIDNKAHLANKAN